MKRLTILLPLLLSACGTQDSLNNGAVQGPVSGNTLAPSPAAPVQTETLVGLYESGPPERRSQMCVTQGGAEQPRFGLVVHGAGGQDCSGTGTITRTGDTLRLTMAGDVACTVEARVHGTQVTFPPTLPAGCSYYCSPGGRLVGQSFDKIGGTAADAGRAEDLVGDRLCGD